MTRPILSLQQCSDELFNLPNPQNEVALSDTRNMERFSK